MNREELAKLVADPASAGNAETAGRVYADEQLWSTFEKALYAGAEPTTAERETIRRVVSERCDGLRPNLREALDAFVARRLARLAERMRDFDLAAAPRGKSLPSDAAEEEPVTFVFVSERTDEAGSPCAAWRAELTLPPDAGADTMLPIGVTDRAGEPLSGGIFKVAGVALPVVRGRAEIPYGMFLSGLKDAAVELTDAGGARSPGTLALF